MLKRIAIAALLFVLAAFPTARPVQAQALLITTCGTVPAGAANLIAGNPSGFFMNTLGQLCVNAGAGGGGGGGGGGTGGTFAPNASFATLTATGSSASVALPTGSAVLFQNQGTTTVSCTLGVGSATATANETVIAAGGSALLLVGSNTFGACIDQTGTASNLVVLAGGAVSTFGNNSDGVAAIANGLIGGESFNMLWNGASWDRAQGITTGTAAAPSTTYLSVNGIRTASPQNMVVEGTAASANVLGSYCMSMVSGTMAAGLAGGSPIISWRYGGPAFATVTSVVVDAVNAGTAFTAGNFEFDLFAARSFTASDTGGNGATLTGNNGKLRTADATTAISDFRASSTATLTAVTRTLDGTALNKIVQPVPITTVNYTIIAPNTPILDQRLGETPFIAATNEGFVIQATVPATGTWTFSTKVCWKEVTAF